jgi:hypothetical protein
MLNHHSLQWPLLLLSVLGLSACEVKKTQEGKIDLPKYEVQKTQEGHVQLPKFAIETPKIEIQKKQQTVTVPTVNKEQRTIDIPTGIQVKPAAGNQ